MEDYIIKSSKFYFKVNYTILILNKRSSFKIDSYILIYTSICDVSAHWRGVPKCGGDLDWVEADGVGGDKSVLNTSQGSSRQDSKAETVC